MMTYATNHTVALGRTPREVVQTLARLVRKPSTFFSLLPEDIPLSTPLIFLVTLSLASAGARVAFLAENRALLFGVFFANALGMAMLTSVVVYVLAISIRGAWSGFSRFFAVTAYAGGAAMLISWIPDIGVWAELWKWVLVGSGLVRACGLSRLQAFCCVGFSIALMTAGFWVFTSFVGALAG